MSQSRIEELHTYSGCYGGTQLHILCSVHCQHQLAVCSLITGRVEERGLYTPRIPEPPTSPSVMVPVVEGAMLNSGFTGLRRGTNTYKHKQSYYTSQASVVRQAGHTDTVWLSLSVCLHVQVAYCTCVIIAWSLQTHSVIDHGLRSRQDHTSNTLHNPCKKRSGMQCWPVGRCTHQ